jgi:hypothetical protein
MIPEYKFDVSGNTRFSGFLGFYNKTPIAQPAAVANSTADAASVSAQLNTLLVRLRNLGVIAT